MITLMGALWELIVVEGLLNFHWGLLMCGLLKENLSTSKKRSWILYIPTHHSFVSLLRFHVIWLIFICGF